MSSFWPASRRWSTWIAASGLWFSLILSSCRAEPAPVSITSTAPPVSPSPTATAMPATDTPSPIANLVVVRTPTPLPAGISPFTGLKVSDPRVLDRMPAAVKISNSPIVRPQSGLSRADVVVEHLAEGGITRFTAIYHSQEAERIGSVRSARLIDLELPVLFDAFLVYSGASGEVSRLLDSSDFSDRTLSDWRQDPGFFRLQIPGRAYDHTLFTDTELLWEVAKAKGWTEPPRYRGWTWSDEPPAGGQPARGIVIPYSDEYSDVRYTYDPGSGAYQRWVVGEPHMDDLTQEQLSTPNVVILYVNHVDTLIPEDVLGSKSKEIQLWGQGRAQLFRDGLMTEGAWIRPNREDPLLFVDAEGRPIPLKPGQVWIEIVPLDMSISVEP